MTSINGQIVFPGDFIGVIEEFIANEGVKEFNGSLFAVKFGRLKTNLNKRIVKVESKRKFLLPIAGDIGIGVVFDVGFESAGIKVRYIENKGLLRNPVTAYVRLPHTSNKIHFKSMYDVVREGDFIRALFLNSWIPYNLSIKDDYMGVIFARCSYCLSPLVLKHNKLICRKCNFHNSRKYAFDYLLKM
ncbi:MAG: exosome complex RNA-binding protein Csl4 [Candidatus Methanomethylicia archaeon]|nr:exosome complex RNA-binding protein Csl4 [Candidatus Methanomethylicia archaeon]